MNDIRDYNHPEREIIHSLLKIDYGFEKIDWEKLERVLLQFRALGLPLSEICIVITKMACAAACHTMGQELGLQRERVAETLDKLNESDIDEGVERMFAVMNWVLTRERMNTKGPVQ